jgi:methyl-accepting chemotaxis protein
MLKSLQLTLKISLYTSLVMVISLLIFALVFDFSERTKVSNDILREGKVFAQFTALSIYQNYTQFYTRPSLTDFESFKARVERQLSLNPDVRQVTLVGINGRILFDSDEFSNGKYQKEEVRQLSDPSTLNDLKKEEVVSREVLNEKGEREIEIIVPVQETEGSHVVSMRYFLTYHTLQERMKQVYQQIVVTVTPLIIFSVILSIPFAVAIVNPIKALTQATEKIRKGNLDVKIKVGTTDEIGQLASSFNLMAEELKKSRGEIEKYNRTLEGKIADRTQELKQKIEDLERLQHMMIGRELKMVELKKELQDLKKK